MLNQKILPGIYLTMPDGNLLINHQGGPRAKKASDYLSGLGANPLPQQAAQKIGKSDNNEA